MCNRYRIEIEFDGLWHAARPHRGMTNLANPTTEVFPDKPGAWSSATAPTASASWSISTITNGRPDYGVTNIRNLDSPHWRGWTGVNNRCRE